SLILSLLPLSARPRMLHRTLAAWSFLAPAATLLLLFTFGPLLFSLWISLHEWHLVDPAHPFTGLDNYRAVLLDATWWSSIRNTAVFTLHVPVAMAVALALALLTQGSRRAIRWARLALFLPAITSVVAIAVVWKWLLNDGYGVVNQVLARAGIGPVAWLTSPDTALASLMLISVWMVVGYQMVVFQAGLAAIPREWYDAARVDGAGPLQRFRHITLPGLRHTLFFVLVTSVIGSFQVFGLVYVMTEGGPLGATDVAVYHIYREAWEFLRFGDAAAMSWILFAVVFAATWLHFRLLEGRREERRAYA
ncbi:MAG: sugar ABC transporter permease, partial [Gemmatimonadetes bacterium]|nr:sugar ABC transporter permease [Gemmatimonadota bacterium]